ncbi:MAG TPA: M23 family metallopeptidase [Rectinemataceae bacterium]
MPEGFREYKRKEKILYAKILATAKAALSWVARAPRRFASWSRKRASILLFPHGEGRSRGFRFTRLGLAFSLVLAGSVSVLAIVSAFRFAYVLGDLQLTRRELAQARGTVDSLRQRVESLTGSALRFETGLSGLLDSMGQEQAAREAGSPSMDDALEIAGLSALLNRPDSQGPAERELDRLEELASYLDRTSPRLDEASALLASQRDLLSEIPNIWPIKGGSGHISMYFGQNENPFSGGQWYLHTGIDISTFRTGDPVVATADGKVIGAAYDAGLGLAVTIQHAHGFLTRYGHLKTIRVSMGQQVAQGQVIGTLGNTGKTTGPHLHYEVHLGTSIIDPLRFLDRRKTR